MKEELIGQEAFAEPSSREMRKVIDQRNQLSLQVQQLQQTLQELRRPEASPRVIVDVLFPPFKRTIDDPAYPEKKTIVGLWYD